MILMTYVDISTKKQYSIEAVTEQSLYNLMEQLHRIYRVPIEYTLITPDNKYKVITRGIK